MKSHLISKNPAGYGRGSKYFVKYYLGLLGAWGLGNVVVFLVRGGGGFWFLGFLIFLL